ncbi:hypothetical protein [Mycolicibacterium flavescens]|uniref:hypothetical protein n=1 Tax=Mycolicibacterium flavescens TaxID=1776 RepID=UPI00197C0D3B|nr:hypothetical protein [Mycolicibacterium flavescens]
MTQNEKSAAAISYDDQLGTSYEFPTRYKKLVVPGEAFVYYRGKRSASGAIQIPHYFGTGIVGAVSPTGDGRLRCNILKYRAFSLTVPFKRESRYFEPGANGRSPKEVGLHFRTGVRTIDQDAFNEILDAAGIEHQIKNKVTAKRVTKVSLPVNTHDSMDALAIALAISEVKDQWPSATIFRAPPGQYFSLIVRHPNGDKHHVSVKSTEEDEPRIHLSEGEVAYASAHAASYSLWVFYALDIQAGTGKLIKRKGRITDDDIDLRAAVHGGRLKNTTAGKDVGPVVPP